MPLTSEQIADKWISQSGNIVGFSTTVDGWTYTAISAPQKFSTPNGSWCITILVEIRDINGFLRTKPYGPLQRQINWVWSSDSIEYDGLNTNQTRDKIRAQIIEVLRAHVAAKAGEL